MCKKTIKCGIILIACLLLHPLTISAEFAGGTGEPNDPYQIATAQQLISIGADPNLMDKSFILINDIDLDPALPGRKVFDKAVIAPDTNVIVGSFQSTPFTGTFNGNAHKISHLKIRGGQYLGLFGQLDYGAKISDLGLDEVDVYGSGECVGGLVGDNYGSITTSYSTGMVLGVTKVGGLAGYNSGNIAASYSASRIGGGNTIGGLAGHNRGSIYSSYSIGTVSGTSDVGGLVGSNGGSIATSYSTGMVAGDAFVGGFAGFNHGIITTSFWDMETSGQSRSAGGTGLTTAEMQDINIFLSEGWDFVDEEFNGTCDSWQISPGGYPKLRYHFGAGPMMPEGLGTSEQPYLIRSARDLGTVWFEPTSHYRLEMYLDLSGIKWSMAVVPWFGGTFDGNVYVISNLHIQGGGHLGLFGDLDFGGKISNLGLEAEDVNGTGECVGGLVGFNIGSVTTSYSTGFVTGDEYVGGLVGANRWKGSVAMSYTTGTVTGNLGVGGLVGYNTSYANSIASSYSTGMVTGNENAGGLVGMNYSSVTSCFWDIETSGMANMCGLDSTGCDDSYGKTTNEMQTAGTFIDVGWDFRNTWIMCEGEYPMLQWEIKDCNDL